MENLTLASLTLVPTKQLAEEKKRLINTKSSIFYFILKLLIKPNSSGQNLRYEKSLMCLFVHRLEWIGLEY